MSNFGELFAGFWDPTLDQDAIITSVSPGISGQTSILNFENTHDYRLGMTLVAGMLYNNPPQALFGTVYIIGVPTSLSVAVNYDFYLAQDFIRGDAKGYIGLQNSVHDVQDWVETIKVATTSITGKRRTITKGTYSNFEITNNLLNIEDPQVRINLSKLLLEYNGQDVILFPHVDRNQIKDSEGNDVLFNMNANFSHVNSLDFRDFAKLRFVSQNYTDVTNNIGT